MHINEMYLTVYSYMLLMRNGLTDSGTLLSMSEEEIITLHDDKRFSSEILEAVKLLRDVGEERFFEEWEKINTHFDINKCSSTFFGEKSKIYKLKQ